MKNAKKIPLFVAGSLAIGHALLFARYTIDDAYITFAYTKNFVNGHFLVFTPGSHVEATSSLLWAILLIPFEAVFTNGSLIGSKVLGVGTILATCFVSSRVISEMLGKRKGVSIARYIACVLMAVSSPFIMWSVYGMENGLVALLLVGAILLSLLEQRKKRGVFSAIIVALFAAARPEGYMYIVLFVAFRFALWSISRGHLRFGWLGEWLFTLCFCLGIYEGFGFLYYGHMFPNTVYAKVDDVSFKRVISGITYVWEGPGRLYVLLYFFSLQLFLFRFSSILFRSAEYLFVVYKQTIGELMIAALIGVTILFAVCVGGDWMVNIRFLSHIIPLILILMVVTGARVLRMFRVSTFPAWVIGFICLAVGNGIVAYTVVNVRLSKDAVKWAERLQVGDERALQGMVDYLNDESDGNPITTNTVVACSDVGRMAYCFKGRILDWWGLADEEIGRSGQSCGRLNVDVFLRRHPDYIILYSTTPKLDATSMPDDTMASYSRPFFSNTTFRSSYVQVAQFLYHDRRWHVLFKRLK